MPPVVDIDILGIAFLKVSGGPEPADDIDMAAELVAGSGGSNG